MRIGDGIRNFFQRPHALAAAHQHNHGAVLRPSQAAANGFPFARWLAKTVRHRQADHFYLFRLHAVAHGALAGALGRHDAQVGARIEPQCVGGYQIGDYRHERRAAVSQDAQHGRVRYRMEANNQIAGVFLYQLARRLAHVRPGCFVHESNLSRSITQMESEAVSIGLRWAHHVGIPIRHFTEEWGRVFFEEIHLLGDNLLAELQVYGLDDRLGCAAMPPTGIREKEEDVRGIRMMGIHVRLARELP